MPWPALGHEVHIGLSCSKPPISHPDDAGPALPSVVSHPNKRQNISADSDLKEDEIPCYKSVRTVVKGKEIVATSSLLGNPSNTDQPAILKHEKSLAMPCRGSTDFAECLNESIPSVLRGILLAGAR